MELGRDAVPVGLGGVERRATARAADGELAVAHELLLGMTEPRSTARTRAAAASAAERVSTMRFFAASRSARARATGSRSRGRGGRARRRWTCWFSLDQHLRDLAPTRAEMKTRWLSTNASFVLLDAAERDRPVRDGRGDDEDGGAGDREPGAGAGTGGCDGDGDGCQPRRGFRGARHPPLEARSAGPMSRGAGRGVRTPSRKIVAKVSAVSSGVCGPGSSWRNTSRTIS